MKLVVWVHDEPGFIEIAVAPKLPVPYPPLDVPLERLATILLDDEVLHESELMLSLLKVFPEITVVAAEDPVAIVPTAVKFWREES